MKLPAHFLNNIRIAEGFDEASFISCHEKEEKITSVRLNPFKKTETGFEYYKPVPWCSGAYYLTERPSFTFDPLFQAGAYYVQEAGSMFIEFALKNSVDLTKDLAVLDLCAAPGGKSTHLNSILSENSYLICNEVIKSRADILSYNLSKWGTCNTAVTNCDPSVFSKLQNVFDVVVADVPCSGSGLFRKQPEALNEWNTDTVALCCTRQKRIIADSINCLKHDGVLIYSTCSYSTEENEAMIEWIISEFGMEYVPLPIEKQWGITETKSGYRFYPNRTKSEGFFCAVLRKKYGNDVVIKVKKNNFDSISKKEFQFFQDKIKLSENKVIFKFQQDYKLINACLFQFLNQFGSLLYFKKTGITIGEIKHNDFIPHHEFALSNYNQLPERIELSKEQALLFLRKEVLNLAAGKGITLMCFGKLGLGWAKILDKRVNNYLPKEFRILSAITD